jgi:hypothetical protein
LSSGRRTRAGRKKLSLSASVAPLALVSAQIIPISASLAHLAYTKACQAGLSGLDALHIAAAKLSEAEEFITPERVTKPLFRVTGIVITTIALP